MAFNYADKKEFEKSIGNFIIHFSELEFALVYFCALIDNPKNLSHSAKKYLGLEFDRKRKLIKDFIYEFLPELELRWNLINSSLGRINIKRRHLIHGTGSSYFYKKSITTSIAKGENILQENFTANDINKLTNEIGHLLTGNDGLRGEFMNSFDIAFFNYYNNLQTDSMSKIVYSLDGIIKTEFKG